MYNIIQANKCNLYIQLTFKSLLFLEIWYLILLIHIEASDLLIMLTSSRINSFFNITLSDF